MDGIYVAIVTPARTISLAHIYCLFSRSFERFKLWIMAPLQQHSTWRAPPSLHLCCFGHTAELRDSARTVHKTSTSMFPKDGSLVAGEAKIDATRFRCCGTREPDMRQCMKLALDTRRCSIEVV